MSQYLHDHIHNKADQATPIPGTTKNEAGGQAYALDCWKRLERFLILGAEGGTYYVGQRDLVNQNLSAIKRCIELDGVRTVKIATDVSVQGRAKDNDPALLVLAMCSAATNVQTRAAAFDALPAVARIGTHLFHFVDFMQKFRGWGPMAKKGVAKWYEDTSVSSLAYDMVKYRQRDGWSHRDVLRKAHPVPKDANVEDKLARVSLFDWATKDVRRVKLPNIVKAHLAAMNASSASAVADLIDRDGLTREMVPTEHLNDKGVWDALAQGMPLTATLRNLGKLSSLGLMEKHWKAICERLGDPEALQRARVHPLAVLVALRQYDAGRGERGSLTWRPDQRVSGALDDAFYLTFPNHRGSGKRIMIALDISASMTWSKIAGTFLTPREASAALAMVSMATEPECEVVCFSSAGLNSMSRLEGFRRGGLAAAPFDKNSKLKQAIQSVERLPAGGTDCSLPMMYASEARREIDGFVILTDNETWAGRYHPAEALKGYRSLTGINAKMVVVGMTSGGFSIADPNDAGMLDVVGFDTATPQMIADFIRG